MPKYTLFCCQAKWNVSAKFHLASLFSLIILTSSFEATPGLFWDGRITRTTPELASLLQTIAPHQREDVSPPTYGLTCNRLITQRSVRGNVFQTWILLAARPTPYH
ncbi:hypothetical protein AVEN_193072-1 [Araneus ventricosus]|uniref:Uncharacterized protein n=1 Tax=Araneus ventricosus TaxID=182803 RepID=A0A4Y2AZU1_ARAVE|nr:hypothetical protein AVEN_193072-1 [Araneus ventricosus]